MRGKFTSQRGQVGLIILLIMVVMVTVGVSVATRSVSELRLSRQEQESTRSLNLAEAGIEEVLSDLSTYAGTPSGNVAVGGINVNYSVTENDFIDGTVVGQGHSFDVVLYDGTTQASEITIKWPDTGDPNDCTSDPVTVAAITVVLIDSAGNPDNVKRFAYDGCGSRNGAANNFTNVAPSGGVFEAGPINTLGYKWARVKALYSDTVVSVTGIDLPTQAYDIETEAPLPDGTTRAVNVEKSADSLPSVFDYVLFSGDTIIKNL